MDWLSSVAPAFSLTMFEVVELMVWDWLGRKPGTSRGLAIHDDGSNLATLSLVSCPHFVPLVASYSTNRSSHWGSTIHGNTIIEGPLFPSPVDVRFQARIFELVKSIRTEQKAAEIFLRWKKGGDWLGEQGGTLIHDGRKCCTDRYGSHGHTIAVDDSLGSSRTGLGFRGVLVSP